MGTSMVPYSGYGYTPRTRTITRDEAALAEDNQQGFEQGQGNAATTGYMTRAQNFDASKAVNQYAQGAWGSISSALGQQLNTLKSQAAGAGRLDTGYFDVDQGRLVRSALDDFSNRVSQQAVAATGLDLRNTEDLGNFGQRSTEDANDLLTSRRQEMENAYRESEARKRSRRAGIGSAIGGILGAGAGALFGAPQIGYGIGSALGGSVAGG